MTPASTKQFPRTHEAQIARRRIPRLSFRLRRHRRRLHASPLHRLEASARRVGLRPSTKISSTPGAASRRRDHRRAEPDAGPQHACRSRRRAQRESLLRPAPAAQAGAGGLEHIDAQQGRIPFAVVSGSSRESVIKSLTTVHLLDRFAALVGSEDYARSKPAPDAFLIAAARLGIAPRDCLVFEDTEMGIQAATAAGMASVRVPSPLERRNWNRRRPRTA